MKFGVAFIAIFSMPIFALETDQFIASRAVIKDSSDVLNKYINMQIAKAIDVANEKNPEKVKCTEVADMVMSKLVGGKYLGINILSQYARKSRDIDKFPDDTVSDKEYFRMTFYEEADFLLKMVPLARTININGIYMGTDKLGHFSLVGRNYYHDYLNFKKDGQHGDEALVNAIIKGFETEKGILGYGLGGVLSFGDLEANYEGMKFAIEMCEGGSPYIILKEGRFEKNPKNNFDIKNYFNPRMDESFVFSFWRPGLYGKVKEKLVKEYCEVKNDPMYLKRISKYPPLVENLNDRLIRDHLLTMSKFDRKLEDVSHFCSGE